MNYGKKTASRILRVAHIFKELSVLASVILLVAATMLIGNTIRLSIFARRREIEVMKLVGASNWFVRGPFMVEGLLCGLLGAAAAVLLLFLGKELVLPTTIGRRFDAGKDVNAIAFEYTAFLVLCSGSCSARPAPRSRCAASCASDRRAQPARQARRGRAVLRARDADHGRPQGAGRRRPGDLVDVTEGRGRAESRVIGSAERIENVLEALLVDKGLREGIEPHEVPEPSLEGRTDFRELTTFTIDPDTAKDFDDAISVRREGDGVRVWVHIADVSYFVPAGSPLDRGAAQRGNSVYVPGLVAPMLPHELADEACSLRPNEDRLDGDRGDSRRTGRRASTAR